MYKSVYIYIYVDVIVYMCVYIYNVSYVYMILWVIMQKKMGSKRLGSGLFMTLQTGRHQRRQAIAHGLILVGTHLAS